MRGPRQSDERQDGIVDGAIDDIGVEQDHAVEPKWISRLSTDFRLVKCLHLSLNNLLIIAKFVHGSFEGFCSARTLRTGCQLFPQFIYFLLQIVNFLPGIFEFLMHFSQHVQDFCRLL